MNIKLSLSIALLCQTSYVFAAATETNTVDNGDGTFTYTQKVNKNSTPPHYIAPDGYGFDFYSHSGQDYGWQHNFDEASNPLVKIQSATLMVRGFDIDSEAFHGTSGEYDGISVDGVDLNPGLLQGTNGTWSETTFDMPTSYILDDGLMDVFLDIDMNHDYVWWKTTIDYSLLTITYAITQNEAPYKPTLSGSPQGCANPTDDFTVNVSNSNDADPDGDPVTYEYRWFVDIGQGEVVDDEVAGKTDHSGNTVLAAEVNAGETWRVQVIATDSNNLVSDPAFFTWELGESDSDCDGISDANDDYPNDDERASNNYSVQSTLAFEDLWPEKGDYDLNDLVILNQFNLIKDANGLVKQIDLDGSIQARGATLASGFAIAFSGTTSANVESISVDINGESESISAEAGHSGELVVALLKNTHSVTNTSESFSFFNTQAGDERAVIPVTMNLIFSVPVDPLLIGNAPFNPFIYRVSDRGREVHLPNYAPTALANTGLFKTGDDNTEVGTETYMTSSGHPWALEISSPWLHPMESVDIIQAYPTMKDWAESRKTTNTDWHSAPVVGKCWKCN
jgi:LruC domain-containing protein